MARRDSWLVRGLSAIPSLYCKMRCADEANHHLGARVAITGFAGRLRQQSRLARTGRAEDGKRMRLPADEVIALLLDHVRAAGSTLLLITHDEELARRCTDRLVRLHDGRLVP